MHCIKGNKQASAQFPSVTCKVVVRTSTRVHYSGNVQYYHYPVQYSLLGILFMLSQRVTLKIAGFLASFAKTLMS